MMLVEHYASLYIITKISRCFRLCWQKRERITKNHSGRERVDRTKTNYIQVPSRDRRYTRAERINFSMKSLRLCTYPKNRGGKKIFDPRLQTLAARARNRKKIIKDVYIMTCIPGRRKIEKPTTNSPFERPTLSLSLSFVVVVVYYN